jgi:hypothetical protein
MRYLKYGTRTERERERERDEYVSIEGALHRGRKEWWLALGQTS